MDVVTLHPPKAWHLDLTGDEGWKETGDYALSSLGSRRTRLDTRFKEHFEVSKPKPPAKAEYEKHVGEVWDKYVAELERDYAREKMRKKRR